MVQIIALAVGRRRRFLMMVGKHIEEIEAAIRNLVIGWLWMSHRRRMNCPRKKSERKNQTGDRFYHIYSLSRVGIFKQTIHRRCRRDPNQRGCTVADCKIIETLAPRGRATP